MRLPPLHSSVQKRNGFTLIELLVVIAILILLMALTLGVMSKVYAFLDETKVTSDVTRLAESCNLFKSEFGRYPPGKIILAEQAAVYANIINGSIAPPPASGLTPPQFAALATYSLEYLSSIFPGINLSGNIHDWNGSGVAGDPGYVILEGHQCLVFFLGGMRFGGSAHTGFNTDKTLPTVGTTGARKGPFFEFEANRLTVGTFSAYNDPYGTPYAYFAAKYPGMNNYPNAYFPVALAAPNDCHTITTTGSIYFVPYFQGTVPGGLPFASWNTANIKFAKAETFQIVSAGKDKQFGTGGQYNQADPEQSQFIPPAPVDMLQANYDNITNVTNGRVVPK